MPSSPSPGSPHPSGHRHRYRRPDHATLDRIRQLHGRGWSDREIADDLNAADGEKRRDEDGAEIKPIDATPPPAGWFTPRQIYYYRCCWFSPPLAGKHEPCKNLETSSLGAARLVNWGAYAARHGWWHLFPWEDRDTGETHDGIVLRPREVDVLCALRDHGSCTLQAISTIIGLSGDARTGSDWLMGRLLRYNLVVRAGADNNRPAHRRGRRRLLYALADGVKPHERTRRVDGIYNLFKRMAEGRN